MQQLIELYNACLSLFEYLSPGKGRYNMMSLVGTIEDVVSLYERWSPRDVAQTWAKNAINFYENETIRKFGLLVQDALNNDCNKTDPKLTNILCKINNICNQLH